MGIWELDFDKYCKVCKKVTNWTGYNDNDDDGNEQFCTEHEQEIV